MAMMISKFHKLIQSKVVWIAFAVLISIAFVWSFTGTSSSSKGTRKDPAKEVVGRLYNKDVMRSEFIREYQNAYLLLILQNGQAVSINDRIDQYLQEESWKRLAMLAKARQMGLTVSEEQVAVAIRQQPIFSNQQTRQFDRNAYNGFFSQALPRLGLRFSPRDFDLMISENLLIDKAANMASQSALVIESEVDHAFHIYSDKVTAQYAPIPRSLAPTPEVTEEDAREYYTSYTNQFVFPEKVKVRYIEFPVADYTNGVEVTDEMVAKVYDANKKEFILEGTENSAVPEYQPLEDVRDMIYTNILTSLARRKADYEAGLLVSELSSQGATFDELAKETGKTIRATTPFALTETVRGIDPTAQPQFRQAAFALEDDENLYYSDPVVGKDNIYVLVLQNRMPSFLPDYEVVADEAMSAAISTAAEKAYLAKAEEVHAGIEAALKAGSSFEAAATEAGLEITTTEPLSLTEPPEDEISRGILQETVLYDAGTLVDLIPTEYELLVVYVAGKEPADSLMENPMLMSQLKDSIRNDKARRLVNAWRDAILEEAQFENLLESASGNDNS